MRRPPRTPTERASSDGGFTLIEVVVAAALFLIGAFATLALLDQGAKATSTSKQRDAANAITQEVVERAAGGRFTSDANGITNLNDMTDVNVGQSAPGPADRLRQAMGDATSAVSPATTTAPSTTSPPPTQGWDITRGGRTFHVSYTACTTSDPVNGGELKGPYDCDPTHPAPSPSATTTTTAATSSTVPATTTGSSTATATTSTAVSTGTTATTNGCTVSTVPVTTDSSTSASAVGLSLRLVGYASLATCLSGSNLINALSPTLCSLARSTPLTTATDTLLGQNGLLSGLAQVNAGVSCSAISETNMISLAAGAATATRLTVSVSWTDANGGSHQVDRTSLVRRAAR